MQLLPASIAAILHWGFELQKRLKMCDRTMYTSDVGAVHEGIPAFGHVQSLILVLQFKPAEKLPLKRNVTMTVHSSLRLCEGKTTNFFSNCTLHHFNEYRLTFRHILFVTLNVQLATIFSS